MSPGFPVYPMAMRPGPGDRIRPMASGGVLDTAAGGVLAAKRPELAVPDAERMAAAAFGTGRARELESGRDLLVGRRGSLARFRPRDAAAPSATISRVPTCR